MCETGILDVLMQVGDTVLSKNTCSLERKHCLYIYLDVLMQVGDTVLSVNGENVVGLTVADIRERIVGPIGSQVSITLESGATGEIFERLLVRGNAQPAERVERLPVLMMMCVCVCMDMDVCGFKSN